MEKRMKSVLEQGQDVESVQKYLMNHKDKLSRPLDSYTKRDVIISRENTLYKGSQLNGENVIVEVIWKFSVGGNVEEDMRKMLKAANQLSECERQGIINILKYQGGSDENLFLIRRSYSFWLEDFIIDEKRFPAERYSECVGGLALKIVRSLAFFHSQHLYALARILPDYVQVQDRKGALRPLIDFCVSNGKPCNSQRPQFDMKNLGILLICLFNRVKTADVRYAKLPRKLQGLPERWTFSFFHAEKSALISLIIACLQQDVFARPSSLQELICLLELNELLDEK